MTTIKFPNESPKHIDFNPNHGAGGLFASKGGAGGGSSLPDGHLSAGGMVYSQRDVDRARKYKSGAAAVVPNAAIQDTPTGFKVTGVSGMETHRALNSVARRAGLEYTSRTGEFSAPPVRKLRASEVSK